MEKWTPQMVADRLEDAVATLRRLPPVKVQGYFNLWPNIKYTEMEVLRMDKRPVRLCALPDAIDRLEETMGWMAWLDAEERKLVWKRAARVRWKTLCWELGSDRTTLWRKWLIAITKVSTRLNA